MNREMLATEAPPRRVVASYRTYADAQRAVDFLSDRKFPVERTAIVAEGISIVEQVTGRTGYLQAALNSALSTAIAGALFGYIFGLFNWVAPLLSALNLAIYGFIIGAIIGALLGLLFHAMSGGRRDFSSLSGIQAERYNVMAEDEVAADADRLLTEMR